MRVPPPGAIRHLVAYERYALWDSSTSLSTARPGKPAAPESGAGAAEPMWTPRLPDLLGRAAWGAASGCRTPRRRGQVVVARIPFAQLIAPGFDGVPVSTGTTVNELNLIAGLSKSKIGSPVVGSTPRITPVACKARNVD
jgi:hypothetical protein